MEIEEKKKKPEKTIQHHVLIYLICAFLFAAIFAIDLLIPLGVAAGVPYVSVVLVSLWIPKKEFTLKVALVSSILTIFGLLYSPMGGELWKVLFNRGLALFAIWSTAILTLQRKTIEEERFQAVQETKVLRGLLPICASCKKIRDDQGYWNQIEIYIEKHSDAYFSHGICRECQDKLYGHHDWYKKKDET
ncbi:MAG: hypothetical protein GY729_13955 [Desulfobacteraceae bacterium]|nr:hypothetical protein [Desulfobacteraceae bacterium]